MKNTWKCYICKEEVSMHDLTYVEKDAAHPKAVYSKRWPGHGICCLEHPGVLDEFERLLKEGAVKWKGTPPRS